MDRNIRLWAAAHAPPPSSPSPTLGSIATRWRELHGERSWQGLLDPIDDDLRAFVIAYGEHASAAYDGFNTERRSPHVGCCLYSHDDLLVSCAVSSSGNYQVTKFLYASTRLASPATQAATETSAATQAATETSTRLASAATRAATEPFFVRPLCEDEGSWWSEVNWMGYVAVAKDDAVAALGRRDIAVVWRGSVAGLDYFKDFDWLFADAKPVLGPLAAAHHAKVHHGFLSVYTSRDETSDLGKTSVQDQVQGEVRRLMEKYKDEVTSITVTGHSLGASLATLNAVDMVAHGINMPPAPSTQPPCPVTAILFASPRVGNRGFKDAFASFHKLRALSVKNKGDPVPSLPLSFRPFWQYVDAATAALPIDTKQSPDLRRGNPISSHNLEVYLHGVAGYNGAGKRFRLVVYRDVVLVNKWADLVKDKRSRPANWWVPRNKCMVRRTDGHWKLDDFKEY